MSRLNSAPLAGARRPHLAPILPSRPLSAASRTEAGPAPLLRSDDGHLPATGSHDGHYAGRGDGFDGGLTAAYWQACRERVALRRTTRRMRIALLAAAPRWLWPAWAAVGVLALALTGRP